MAKAQSVLIIGINFFPEPTGIGKYTGELAFALAARGFTVEAITGIPYYPQWQVYEGYSNVWYKKECINGVSVTRCPMYIPGSLTGGKRMLQDLSFFITALGSLLVKMLSGKAFNMVFVASPSFLSGFLGLFYKVFYRTSVFVYHVQDLQVDAAEELQMIRNTTLLNLLKKAQGKILKGADAVTTISTGMMARIKKKPVKMKRLLLFPNWVDFTTVYAKTVNREIVEKLGIPLDKQMIFYSGAVGEKQGLETVLDAAGRAMKEAPGLVFVIAGSGPYARLLKNKGVEAGLSNLVFIDLQPLPVFNELLNHAFLHLVIQKDKASDLLLPSKLTNILAVGGVAIVTASPQTSLYDIVKTNQLGIVVPPDDPRAFWQAIKEVYHTSQRLQLLKVNAAGYAANYLDKEIIIDRFLSEMNMVEKASKQKILV